MMLIIISKPDIIYDHKKEKFREFGQSFWSLETISIITAILVFVIFLILRNVNNQTSNIQYIPISPFYQQAPIPFQHMYPQPMISV